MIKISTCSNCKKKIELLRNELNEYNKQFNIKSKKAENNLKCLLKKYNKE